MSPTSYSDTSVDESERATVGIASQISTATVPQRGTGRYRSQFGTPRATTTTDHPERGQWPARHSEGRHRRTGREEKETRCSELKKSSVNVKKKVASALSRRRVWLLYEFVEFNGCLNSLEVGSSSSR